MRWAISSRAISTRAGARVVAGRRFLAWACALALAPGGLACDAPTAAPRPPSILLVVFDTLRADAVSAYGHVEGTTPNVDALAREGLLYRHAFAPAPWTLPSHASLLTALPVQTHRLGMPGRLVLPDEVVTIAERLREAGYETAAFSENMIVGDVSGLLQGFETRRATELRRVARGEKLSSKTFVLIDVVKEVELWLADRDPSRPFFAFVNLFDAHGPYEIRDDNPFVAPDVSRAEIERRPVQHELLLCSMLPPPGVLKVLRGLYLGDVAAADAKLGGIVELMRERGPDDLVIVVTSDHGEFLGERRLLGHEFSLGAPVLDVPLIVHGLGDRRPARIDVPVTLEDVGASILGWAGLSPGPEQTAIALPEDPTEERPERDLLSAYSDEYVLDVDEWKGVLGVFSKDGIRKGCVPSEPVWGGKAALIRYPLKLHWHADRGPELYDLSWDPGEESDLASQRPEQVAELRRDLEAVITSTDLLSPDADEPPAPSEDVLRALRELGYVE